MRLLLFYVDCSNGLIFLSSHRGNPTQTQYAVRDETPGVSHVEERLSWVTEGSGRVFGPSVGVTRDASMHQKASLRRKIQCRLAVVLRASGPRKRRALSKSLSWLRGAPSISSSEL